MAKFKYDVRGSNGQVVSGVIEAGSLADATAKVRANGGYLVNIAPCGGGDMLDKLRNVRLELGPGLRDLHGFTTQLAVMVRAGINIRNAIHDIADQVENHRFKSILESIRDDVESGRPFSEALADYPKVFPPLYINMIRASELSGSLSSMLGRIAANLNSQMETRSMVRGAMIYPVILASLAIGATIFLLTWVLPRFTVMFEGKEDRLPQTTKMLMGLSDFLRLRWKWLVAGVVAMVVAFKFGTKTPTGSLYWDRCKLKMPLAGKMFRALYITRGVQTLGELVNAGVPMLETLQITADISGNQVHRNMWLEVRKQVQEGSRITPPLRKMGVLPTNVIQMIAAGEESGNLGEVLAEVSTFYMRELKERIKAFTSMLEPMMICVMGVVVGFIALSIIMPVFKMSSIAAGK
jgi:type IV pilus assembly protein PilC